MTNLHYNSQRDTDFDERQAVPIDEPEKVEMVKCKVCGVEMERFVGLPLTDPANMYCDDCIEEITDAN